MAFENEQEEIDSQHPGGSLKEYQTLFWVPMLFQTAKNAESLIDEMLELIQDFHSSEHAAPVFRRQSAIVRKVPGQHKRRQQILGEVLDSEITTTTRVDVVIKSENSKYTLLSVLKQHFLFSQLRDYELEDVIDVMHALYVGPDEVIIQEGDAGDLFYILEEGKCEILIGEETVGLLEAGTSFGDLALMYNCPRAATIRSIEDCTLWTLDRIFFRQAMVTSSSNQNVQLSQFLSKIQLFETIGVQKLNQLARSLTKLSFDDGHYIIKQGDLGDQFYVLYKGQVRCSMTDDTGNEKYLMTLHEGEVFGERALIRKEPRKANIVADGPVECYYLEAHDFYSMLGEFVDKFTKINEFRIIRAAKIFEKLSDSKLKEVQSKLVMHRMFSGQRVVCGYMEIYLVMDGTYVSTNGEVYSSDGTMQVGTLEKCADQVAGALMLQSDEGFLASIHKDLIENALAEDIQEKNKPKGDFTSSGAPTSESLGSKTDDPLDIEKELSLTTQRRLAMATKRRQTLSDLMCSSLDGLELIQPLGKGTFGSVYLCGRTAKLPTSPSAASTHSTTSGTLTSTVINNNQRYVALKCLDKKALVDSGQYHYVQREIVALQNFSHPFLSEYYGVVVTAHKIFFLLEFISGGELWSYLYDEESPIKKGMYGGVEETTEATNFASTVLLALEHMHGLGYAYRDLKPENLLISSNGYLKLVDFGFAKQVPFVNKSQQIQYRTFTLCGTPDYMAPELVLTQGHDKSADFWAYGVLLYEIINSRTPFESGNQQRTFEKIVHSQKHLSFPNEFNPHCKSLIRRLLHPNAALRLGALQNGIDDIKNHAFFAMQNVDFGRLLRQEIPMLYVPKPFVIGGKTANPNIEVINLDEEKYAQLNDEDYGSYFQNIAELDDHDH